MIKYELINEKKAIKKSLSLVSDRLHERVFATENIYVNGKLKTHSGIINKSCQLISDKSCGESEIMLNYDGSINKFIITISKEIVCKTKVTLNIQTNKLRAQVVILNNTNFLQCIEFHNINLSSSTIYINPHDFVILDTVCISKCCTGTFEKQPEEDLIKNEKLNKQLLNSDFFSEILNKVDLGSLENVQNTQNISNSILISKNGKFILNEIDKKHNVYIMSNVLNLNLSKFSNINVFIENVFDNDININLTHKIKRGFVSVINKTSQRTHLIFTGNVKFTIGANSKLTLGYSPYNTYLSMFNNTYTIENGDNITSETLFEGIQEFRSEYHTSEGLFWPEIDTIPPIITMSGGNNITHDYGVVYDYEFGVSAVDQMYHTVSVTKTEGIVQFDTIGTYTITYTATDDSGNTSTIDRTVTVVDTPTSNFPNLVYENTIEYSNTDLYENYIDPAPTSNFPNLVYENTIEYPNTDLYENYI